MSLDMVADDKLGVSVERALSSGTVIVASAVNTATHPASQYPAAYPGVLAVGGGEPARTALAPFAAE